ncbi:hypothetical protein ABFS83_02G097300 [Erythranthe nasuta]
MMRFNHYFLIFLPFINFLFLHACGKSGGVCISQGGRFPPFSSEGKAPKKAARDALRFCRVFRKRTCCDASQTHAALLSIRKLSSYGEGSQDCLQLWELVECSICDPLVGVQRGPPLICSSLCDRLYQACSTAYFAMDAKTQALSPCGVDDFVCGRASEWVSNGTELCRASGFSVTTSSSSEEEEELSSCYGGKASLDYISNSWKNSHSDIVSGREHKDKSFLFLGDFRQWISDMQLNKRVPWAVGGMVLTAGLVFASKRKTHNQRQKQAGRKLGTRKSFGK